MALLVFRQSTISPECNTVPRSDITPDSSSSALIFGVWILATKFGCLKREATLKVDISNGDPKEETRVN